MIGGLRCTLTPPLRYPSSQAHGNEPKSAQEGMRVSLLLLFVLFMIGVAIFLLMISLTMAAAIGDRTISDEPDDNGPHDGALAGTEPRPLA